VGLVACLAEETTWKLTLQICKHEYDPVRSRTQCAKAPRLEKEESINYFYLLHGNNRYMNLVDRTYDSKMHICICACKHQNRQVLILSSDKI
jgi:hypothetical protein